MIDNLIHPGVEQRILFQGIYIFVNGSVDFLHCILSQIRVFQKCESIFVNPLVCIVVQFCESLPIMFPDKTGKIRKIFRVK